MAVASTITARTHIDDRALRARFPVLNQPQRTGLPPLSFLDSAASSQKPQVVIDALRDYYEQYNANIHRGVYHISERATAAYEEARRKVATFINARSHRECVFVRNTTEAINLVAQTWARANLKAGDLIVFTTMEHHSNIVPWHLIAEQKGARIAAVRMAPDGRLDAEHYAELLAQEPVLVAFTHISNSLGTVNPVREMVARAHAVGAVTLVDAAQSVPHMTVDVQDLDCDFLAFSGHKMCGPMGAGVLYGKKALLDAMPPFLGGGSMIRKVELDHSTYADSPTKFEAGTPAVGDAIGLGVAIDFLTNIGMHAIWRHEQETVAYALERLGEVPNIRLFGSAGTENRAAVISFEIENAHPHDVAAVLDEQNIAVRAGHHCTQPLMHALDVVATTRASFYLYNGRDDVDRLVAGLARVNHLFNGGATS